MIILTFIYLILAAAVEYRYEATLAGVEFTQELKNKTSPNFIALKRKTERELNLNLEELNVISIVTDFKEGSVVAV